MIHRLFREHCVFHRGSYVKDLSRLGRDVSQCVIVDNSPASYLFHPYVYPTLCSNQESYTIILHLITEDKFPYLLLFFLAGSDNAVPVKSWFDDPDDRELLELIPFFENLAKVSDISKVFR